MKQKQNYYGLRRKLVPYLFISPFFILFAVFMLYPFLFSVAMSLADWNGIAPPKFTMFANYVKLWNDNIFWSSIVNSIIIYLMYVPVMVMLALLFGYLLMRPWLKGKAFFRMVLYVPNITAVIAVAFVFLLIFGSTDSSPLNALLHSMGIQQNISWFGSKNMARFSISVVVLWRWLGYNMILMMAGLGTIDDTIYEAAEIDGANSVQKFFRITMPLMRHSILFSCVMSTIGTFSLFTEPMIMTKGGPMNSTITTVLHIYNTAFQNLKMGYASAIAVVYFFLMVIITLLQFKLNKAE